ncbi:hypothetical protein [Nostocoides sp. Soil756]|jgi:hypothetical protein|uniref:hypothetical protein n=1 Tax=Nostocoides sp. Soil756 TaxID=1736399 RepID=UPI0006F72EE1|nr:hypothetical protein [Tetrasphaera sp. Soil756]KRE63582.1 hypothetical protein ASG78_01420 [Tetrasphaera sp. Soil756]
MPVLAHPGPSAPAAPAVHLTAPDGWAPVPAGDALLRVSAPGSQEQAVDIQVRHLVAPEGTTAAVVIADTTAARGGEVEDPFVVDLGGREWHARNVSWDEDGTPVVEVHLATPLSVAEGCAPHLLVVGRVAGTGIDDDYDTLQNVLESVTVEGGP